MNSESLRPHFLDSSALVKLVIYEQGSDGLRAYYQTHSWFETSPLCVAEALGVLKRKWSKRQVADREYYEASWKLLSSTRDSGRVRLTPEKLEDPAVFFGARELTEKYHVDLADALQLYALSRGSLVKYCEGSRAVLVSGDSTLASAARSEGLLVWDCVHESSPP